MGTMSLCPKTGRLGSSLTCLHPSDTGCPGSSSCLGMIGRQRPYIAPSVESPEFRCVISLHVPLYLYVRHYYLLLSLIFQSIVCSYKAPKA